MLTSYVCILYLVTCYLMYITIVMLSLYTKHDTPDSYNYHDNGNVVPNHLL